MENPYQSSAIKSQKPNRIHVAVLRIYMKYRGRDMPFSHPLLMYFKRWLFTILLMIGVVMILTGLDGETEGLIEILMGMLLGVILRDMATCRLTSRLWPFTRELLDWEVVQARFEEIVN